MAQPAPTFSVTLEPDRKAVRIDATCAAGATGLYLWRVSPSGHLAYVRGWAPGTVTGATPVIARDYEAPLELELDYYAQASDATGLGATGGPHSITIDAGECEAWLIDLARPVNSLPILIESFEELHYEAATGVHRVLGRRAPVLTSLPAWTPTGELILLTDDLAERDAMLGVLGSGFPVLVRTHPILGIGNLYAGVTDWVEARIVPAGAAPYRRFRVAVVQVERPDPALFTPSVPNTYAAVKASFVDYAEVLALAHTYDNLAEHLPG